jgi:hypothetical protein
MNSEDVRQPACSGATSTLDGHAAPKTMMASGAAGVQPRAISTDMDQPFAMDFTGACAAIAAMVFGAALPT